MRLNRYLLARRQRIPGTTLMTIEMVSGCCAGGKLERKRVLQKTYFFKSKRTLPHPGSNTDGLAVARRGGLAKSENYRCGRGTRDGGGGGGGR